MHGAYQVVSGLSNWLFKVLMLYKIISRLPTYILSYNQPPPNPTPPTPPKKNEVGVFLTS